MDVDSIIIYNLIFVATLFFSYLAQITKDNERILYRNIALIIVSLFCGLRFNVGNDYGGYVALFEAISIGHVDKSVEPGFNVLNLLFSDNPLGYQYVLFITSFFTVFVLGIAFWRGGIFHLGIFFLFTSELLLLINDQVRQGAAIAVFFYSIRFIENRQFWRYLVCVIFAAFFFHYTAIVLVLAYFVIYFDLKKWMWLAAITLSFIMYRLGYFNSIIFFILERIPYYDRYLIKGDRYIEPSELGSGLAVLLWYVLALFVVLYKHRIRQVLYVKLFLLGTILYFITLDFPLVGRAAAYLFYCKVFAFSYLVQAFKPRTSLIPAVVLLISFLFFQIEVSMNLGKHGGFPYQTIFNKDEQNIERK